MSQGRLEARPGSLARPGAAAWLGLAALALVAWREGLVFAVSEGGAHQVENILFDAADNPPWVIATVVAALLASRWRDLRAALGSPGSLALASLLLAPGLALLAWARFVSAPELALLGTVAMALGTAYALHGGRLLRLLAVPLALLLFAIPAPGALVNQVVYPLQLWTADYAAALLRPLPLSALQSADVIRTPSHNFLVIEGCSGLGSMEVLTLLALAWAWQTRNTFREGLALVLAAPPIAFALNGFRVVSLVLLPDAGFWSNHTTQGVVAFALGALAIALLDRFAVRRGARAEEGAAPAPRASLPARPPLGLLLWLGAAALASLVVPRYAAPAYATYGALLPETLPHWSSEERPIDALYLGSVRTDRAALRTYTIAPDAPARPRIGSEPVGAFVAEDARQNRATSLLSPKLELPGRGWRAEQRTLHDLPGRTVAARVVARGEARRALSYTLYLGLGTPFEEALRAFLALDRSPFRWPERAHAVRLTTELPPDAGAERLADRRLVELFQGIRPRLEALQQKRAQSPREGG